MASLKSSQGVSLLLVALLVCQAFIVPALARTQVAEKKLLEAPQTIGSEKSVQVQGGGYDGHGHGDKGHGHDGHGHGDDGHHGGGHGGHGGHGDHDGGHKGGHQ